MLFRKSTGLTYADVTPRSVYLDRRKFLRGLGVAGLAAVAGKSLIDLVVPSRSVYAGTKLTTIKGPFSTDEKINSFNDVTHYNNFYEFGVDKDQPAKNSQKFVALCGRLAPRRSHAPASASLRRHVWRNAAKPGWRTGAHDRTVEIWIQEHQVLGENPFCQRPAAHYMEYVFLARVRLLFQRESRSRS